MHPVHGDCIDKILINFLLNFEDENMIKEEGE